ncbi:probable G-protein coupled receptor Mth-like 7 [Drosophila takahashii]|uniref:probable G-protein coupled receptor Mth-like 7 n=1 Tax=Drosophila takahashii TaxID=29030 RepID=UPI003899236D
MPLVGYSKCWLEAWGPSYWIFIKGPILITTLFNIMVFILSVSHIWKVKSELRMFKQDEERTIQCFNFDTETYLMFLRLSCIMGTFWILEFLYCFQDYTIFQPVWYFLVYMEKGLGIIVFILLILKRNTLKLLLERIRER